MIQLALVLVLALGVSPSAAKPKPQAKPESQAQAQPAAASPTAVLALGPPRLLDIEIRDGGYKNIDEGVLLSFTPQGRRYEVWEVQKNVAFDHALVLAYDPAGQELWRTRFKWEPGDAWGNALASTVDEAGDFYFMYITMGGGSSYKWRLVKVKQSGAIAWQKTLYTTSWGQEPTFMAAHPQGGIVILSAAHGQVRDLYTARVSSAGEVTWEKKFDVDGDNQFPGALVVAGDGSIYVVGDDKGTRVRKYAANGLVKWTKDYPGATQYERPKGRHAYLDAAGDLVVVGSTYAGGNEDDWYFIAKYGPDGDALLNFVQSVGPDVKLTDHGLKGVYAVEGPDGAVYLAWDHDDALDSAWTLTRVQLPVRAIGPDDAGEGAIVMAKPLAKLVKKPGMTALPQGPVVSWTKTFGGDAAMSVERLLWVPNGAVGVLGRGKRELAGHDYRADTRLRALTPAGVDLGMAKFASAGDFNNEPSAAAIGPGAAVHVLGWQYWSGDGWNDENVMRLRFALRP